MLNDKNEKQEAFTIFCKAQEFSKFSDQDDFVVKACAEDSQLLLEVTALLNSDREAGSFLAESKEQTSPNLLSKTIFNDSKIIEKHGSQIGRYKLLQKIGEGGMGTVWMAEQREPVRRRVALKLIKDGRVDKQVIARFEAERQALALMDHENIARILDAGTTEIGTPYFVMELVQGIPINEYCDRNKLTPSDRLKLFVPVCKAVQHAHQKGIIHRDLKPNNVLVHIHDGKPVAKVIDFGLAKALQCQTKLTEKTMFTEFGLVMGTLQYMSPEQATMDALNIDTRSDIYSLGVMLYELLAGSTPIDKDTIKKHAALRVLEFIRDQEPPRPSQRLSSSGEGVSSIGELRQIQPVRLQQILRGELDWIVMKSLEKDRSRRYDSANDMAEDINRYLKGDIVLARPPSTSYRVSKFVRKNKGLVASLVTIAGLLVSAVAVSTYFAIEANLATKDALKQTRVAENKTVEAEQQRTVADQERNNAEKALEKAEYEAKVTQEMLTIVTNSFVSVDPNYGATHKMSAKDVLINVRSELNKSDLDDAAKSRMLTSLSTSLRGIGEYDDAVKASNECVAILTKTLGQDHPSTLRNKDLLALVLRESGQLDKAIELQEEVLAAMRIHLGVQDMDTVNAMSNYAISLADVGRTQEALELQEEAVELSAQHFGEASHDTLRMKANLASVLDDNGKKEDALDLLEETLALKQKNLGPQHPDTLAVRNLLAISYIKAGRINDAISFGEETLELTKQVFGLSHSNTLLEMHNLANSYETAGRLQDALVLKEEVLPLFKQCLGDEHPRTSQATTSLAALYLKMDRLNEGIKLYKQAIASLEQSLGVDNPQTLSEMISLGSTLSNNRIDLPEALRIFHTVYVTGGERLGEDHPLIQLAKRNLAVTLGNSDAQMCQYHMDQFYDEAEILLESMIKYHGPHSNKQREIELLTRTQLGQRDWQATLETTRGFLEGNIEEGQFSEEFLTSIAVDEAIALSELGRYEEAEAVAVRVIQDVKSPVALQAQAKGVMAICLANQGEFDKAKQLVVEARAQMESGSYESPAYMHFQYTRAIERCIKVHELVGDSEQVEIWKNKLAELESSIKTQP